ncbi:MAG: plasminogen-binding N-terminal domain-containing protein [Campylobacterales bacterium]|nr:plasminogen-binding N-terminal domain-containing protein [Campylobacterales bacterium]
MRYLLIWLFPFLLFGGSLHSTVERLIGSDQAVVHIDTIDVGVSGVILHRFDATHSTILARCVVSAFDQQRAEAILTFSPFESLSQPSLPQGRWEVSQGDTVILAQHYERALLLSAGDDAYHAITKRIAATEWIHPDTFAALLSYKGHPSPLREDIHEFCTQNAIGLLYIHANDTLFTLDCQSLSLLELTPAPFELGTRSVPFYSRIPKINANWFGEGSDEITDYDRYYLELIALNNPQNSKLDSYLKSKESRSGVGFDQNTSEQSHD